MGGKKEGQKISWERDRREKWEGWSGSFMGLIDPPYQSLQLLVKAKFIAYDGRLNWINPFQWEVVKLNLLESDLYDPKLPWVMKVR